MTPPPGAGPSKVERIKAAGNGLEGTIAATLDDPEATHFGEADLTLIKFHGTYQQDDRDLRIERRRAGLDKAWIFMVRTRIPGGSMVSRQFLALESLARRHANGTLRLTSRQGIQFHGVSKAGLRPLIRGINQEAGLTTLGACGDINRNVMCDPAARLDWRVRLGMHRLADAIAEHLSARTSSYWEIWCNGERDGGPVTRNREEPLYGEVYMPRKFKIGIAVPENNNVHLYTQDIGIEVVHRGGTLIAYDLIVGGGMGSSHGAEATYPRLGTRLARASSGDIMQAVEALLTIQRDFGDRSDRRHARFKYVVQERGADWVREQLFRRLGRELEPAGPMPAYQVDDMLGWRQAHDGSLMAGIHVLNGRLGERGGHGASLAGVRAIVETHAHGAVITPSHDLVLTGIDPSARPAVERIMADHGLSTGEGLAPMRRLAMACVALPTCGLALAESERYLPDLLAELERLGVGDAPVQILMTGCPNACVRSPVGEISVVGRGPGKYAVSVGGNQEGTRLAFKLLEKVDAPDLAGIIHKLIGGWRGDTGQGVPFGDWATTRGADALRQLVQPADQGPE